MIALVQSNDPHIDLNKFGGRSAMWNEKEWFTKDREDN